MFQLHPILFPM